MTVVQGCTLLVSVATFLFSLSVVAFLLPKFLSNDADIPNRATGINFWYVDTKVFTIRGEVNVNAPREEEDKTNGEADPTTQHYALHRIDCWGETKFVKKTDAGTLVFFIHGNSGSYKQGVRLGCTVLQQCSDVKAVYSFDFKMQANVHRGRLLQKQAAFVSQAVSSLLNSQENLKEKGKRQHGGTTVWFIGHSMGGVVAHLVATMMQTSSGMPHLVDHIITINSPHRYPPLFLDPPMLDVYTTLWGTSAKGSFSAGCQQCFPSHLVSITSGALDLQVEQGLTRLDPKMCDAPEYSVVYTEDPAVCGRMYSHNGALYKDCVANFVASLILSSSTKSSRAPQRKKQPCQLSTKGEGSTEYLPTTNKGISLSQWASLSMTRHTFPFSVVSYYMALLISPIHSLFPHLVGDSERKCMIHTYRRLIFYKPCSSYLFTFAIKWKALLKAPVLSVVVITVLTCIISRLLMVELPCCLFPDQDGCRFPWVSDSLICNQEIGCCVLICSLIAVLGPALLGSLFGVATYHLLYLLLSVSTRGWMTLRLWLRERTLRFKGLRHVLQYWYNLPLLLYLSAALFCGWPPSTGLCCRAFVWFTLSILLPPLCVPLQDDVLFFSYSMITHRHAQIAAYALVHMLNLYPFFVLRNFWFSNTEDDISLINGWCCVLELLLHVLLISEILWQRFHFIQKNSLKYSKKESKYTYCSSTLMLPLLLAIVVACFPLAFSLLLMCSAPVETFRVTWVLLCAFPVVLFKSMAITWGKTVDYRCSATVASDVPRMFFFQHL